MRNLGIDDRSRLFRCRDHRELRRHFSRDLQQPGPYDRILVGDRRNNVPDQSHLALAESGLDLRHDCHGHHFSTPRLCVVDGDRITGCGERNLLLPPLHDRCSVITR